jgi:hypothetical protein
MNKKQFNDLLSKMHKIKEDIENTSGVEARLIIKTSYFSTIVLEIKYRVSLNQLEEIINYFKSLGYYLHEIEAEDYYILLHFDDVKEE